MTRHDEPPSRAYLLLAIVFLLWLYVSAADAQTVLTIDGKVVYTSANTPVQPPVTPPVTPPVQPPVTPPAGCAVADAPSQLGGIPPIPSTVLGATQVIAYRIASADLNGKGVGVYQPSAGMTVAISATPCDLGPPALSTSGCYFNAPGNNPQQILLRVGQNSAYMTCKLPAGDPLYVNLAFTGYTNYGQPLTNFCLAQGKTHCSFQFRRDP
jgi:hypothetical protein